MPDAAVLIHRSGLEVVRFFTVLRDVQTFDLFRFGHAHAGNHIRYFQQHNGSDQREAPGNQYAHKLVAELAPVSVHSANRLACAKNRIDHLLSEDAGQERADRSAGAVNSESVQGIIVAEDRFYLRDHVVADQAGDKADCQGRHRAYESRRWSNCYQSSHGPGDRA